MTTRILVAGIGNIFLGDDGFGSVVARRLALRVLPKNVVVMDVGIRGLDLTYALMDGYDAAILIDVVQRGGPAGTLYVVEPELDQNDRAPDTNGLLDMHSVDPHRVLTFLRASGVKLGTLRIVGCEPASFGSDEEPQDGLSAPVAASVDAAIACVEGLLREIATGVDTPTTARFQIGEAQHA